MKTKIILILLILVIPCTCFSASWYVRPTSGDCTYNGNGTASTCAASAGTTGSWKGFTNVVWGGSGVKAGDTLYLVSGLTYPEANLNFGASGSSWSSPITLSVYGGGTATINASGQSGNVFNINNQDYISIDGVIGDANAGNTTYGLRIINLPDGVSGFYNGSGNDTTSHVRIAHVEFTGTQATNLNYDDYGAITIYGSGQDYEISYCWIHGTNTGNTATYWHIHGIVAWAGPWPANTATNYTCKKFHDNRLEYLFHDGMKSGSSSSFYNNYLIGIVGSGHSDSLLCQSGSYCAIYNNFVSSGDQQIYIDEIEGSATFQNILIYNNEVNSTIGHGIQIATQGIPQGGAAHVSNVRIYNNTINVSSYCFWINGEDGDGTITGIHIVNNICYQTTGSGTVKDYALHFSQVPAQSMTEFDYNVWGTSQYYAPILYDWAGTYYTLAQIKANTAFEQHSYYANPTFVSSSDFHLQASDTVARDKGTSLAAYFTTDKDGNIRSGTWDIGAYEYGAGGSPSIPTSFGVKSQGVTFK